MTVIGESQVREEVKKGRRQIVYLQGDIITPQAREAIATFGLELVQGPLPAPEPQVVDPATAVRRVLYRSAPRWMAPDPPVGLRPRRLSRLAVVGAGNVGTTVAHLAAASDMAAEITLVDVVAGLAASVALDVEHSSGVTGASVKVSGGSESGLLAGAEVVVITAGRPRSPGMDRAGLIAINGRVVRSVAEEVAAHAPEAVMVVVTNPLDEMTVEALSASGFGRKQVLGMAGTLDSSRLRYLLAREAGVSPRDVQAVCLGRHGPQMVPVLSRATIKGRPVGRVLSSEQIQRCVEGTIGGGGAVVSLRRTGSAFLAPGHAICEVLDALRGQRAGMIPVSVMLEGEYGMEGVVLGVPALLGKGGLIEVVEMALSEEEHRALREAGEGVRASLEAARALSV
ncbi:MAG: malate dehydrogenase [Actinomycetia bacterium]|nr:malate dehydrogenase [Actinomycetes bacterium]